MTLKEQLDALLGPGVAADDPETLAANGGDKWFASHAPEAVVFAESTEQVSRLMAFASEKRIPVTPRGGGVGYVGGCVPVRGGI
ncbi:MAG: FAD-binding protein, partial [Chthoniobacteraceae bacterium]|nr:FAD-binding protein [Chthoniobacteraceae bacterium]